MKKAKTTILAFALSFTLLSGILGIMSVYAQNIYGVGDFIVPVGETANVTGDVTGNITVYGTLNLTGDHTITGTVTVNEDGQFYMSDGTITGPGRGVEIRDSGSVFTMSGGTIEGNIAEGAVIGVTAGAGVRAERNAVFNMTGGIIRDNTTTGSGGGVAALSDAVFNMEGGVIQGNAAGLVGGVGGGGVYVVGSTFNMFAPALIYDNHSLSPQSNGGGGVRVTTGSVFTMHGGTIAGNTAQNGGGIEVWGNSTAHMINGRIEDNSASIYGGGVSVGPGSIFNMHDGHIYNNFAEAGGGINLHASADTTILAFRAIFNMYGGFIQRNFITSSADYGGGIRIISGVATISGGTIGGAGGLGNTSVGAGGGIAVRTNAAGKPSVLEITGDVNIIGNSAATDGGGIWVQNAGNNINIASGSITNNSAVNGYGGGIYVFDYGDLTVGSAVQFRNNIASSAHNHGAGNRGVPGIIPPNICGGRGERQNIDWDTVSIRGTHALNNFDINYSGGIAIDVPEIYICKELIMPYGTDVPNVNFIFDITLVSVFPERTTLPAITIPSPSIPFNSGMTPAPHPDYSGYVYVRACVPVNLLGVSWSTPGVYRFRVTERPVSSLDSNSDYTIIYDPSIFYLYVYVGRLEGIMTNPLQIIGYYARHRVPADVCNDCEEDDNCPTCAYNLLEKKPVVMPFENRLSRRPQPTSFEVEKIVTGRMGNPNLPFNFTVEMRLPESTTFPLANAIEATITGYARDVDDQIILPATRGTVSTPIGVSVDSVNGVITYTFTLRHGDIISFSNVPIGTTYTVTEDFVAGYDQSGTINGDITSLVVADDDEDLVISGTVLPPASGTAVTNFVTVTNTHDGTPPMGVLLSNMPFGLMVALGAGALGLTATAVIVSSKVKRKR